MVESRVNGLSGLYGASIETVGGILNQQECSLSILS